MSPISNDRRGAYLAPPRRHLPFGLVTCAVLGLGLAGCASGPPREQTGGPDAAHGEVAGVVSVDVQQRYGEALALLESEDYAAARAALEEVIAAYPELVGPRVNLGIAYARDEKFTEAEQALQAAVALRPEAAEAWNELGVVYRHMGRFLSAQEAYAEALEHAPDYAIAHYNAAVLHDLYLRQPAQALDHYRQYRVFAAEPDEVVETWIADLERRLEQDQRTAGVVDENL